MDGLDEYRCWECGQVRPAWVPVCPGPHPDYDHRAARVRGDVEVGQAATPYDPLRIRDEGVDAAMKHRVTVVIPVGPHVRHARFLREALDSVHAQTYRETHALLVDDMHGLTGSRVAAGDDRREWFEAGPWAGNYVWRAPWRLGVAHAFNVGVALAPSDLVVMMGADDVLETDFVERMVAAYERTRNDRGYYFATVRYMDTGELQTLPCNAAMVHRRLWEATGGFHPETASGACDAAFISRMLVHAPDALIHVPDAVYHYRRHEDTDTAGRGSWQGVILETRNLITQRPLTPLEWGRVR